MHQKEQAAQQRQDEGECHDSGSSRSGSGSGSSCIHRWGRRRQHPLLSISRLRGSSNEVRRGTGRDSEARGK
eukprot:1230598-Pyramimonas_sp.AAC.1